MPNGKQDAGQGQPYPFITHAPGMLEPGNISLWNRPMVRNPEGGISTVHSASFDEGDHAVLVPTVIGHGGSGRLVSPKEAYEHYRQTGEHLGKFDNYMSADAYSKGLHLEQSKFYHRLNPQYVGSYAEGGVIDPAGGQSQAQAETSGGVPDPPSDLAPILQKAAKDNNVDYNLFKSQIHQESHYDPTIYGKETRYGRARGLGQLMPDTARQLGLRVDDKVDERTDPVKNATASAKYLRSLLDKYHGDTSLALAEYNTGAKNMREAGGNRVPNIAETQDYVNRIQRGAQTQNQGGLNVIGPDGKHYLFNYGTSRQQMQDMFRQRGITGAGAPVPAGAAPGATVGPPTQTAPATPAGGGPLLSQIAPRDTLGPTRPGRMLPPAARLDRPLPPDPWKRQPGEGYWEYQSRVAMEQYKRQAQMTGDVKLSVPERLMHSGLAYTAFASSIGADTAVALKDPKNWAILATGLVSPWIPAAIYTAEGLKGAYDAMDRIKDDPSPENVKAYIENAATVIGSMGGFGESPKGPLVRAAPKAAPALAEFFNKQAAKTTRTIAQMSDWKIADFNMANALRVARQFIIRTGWSYHEGLEKAATLQGNIKDGLVRAFDQTGQTLDHAQNLENALRAEANDANERHLWTPQLEKRVGQFVNRIKQKVDFQTGQRVPVDLRHMTMEASIQLQQGMARLAKWGEKLDPDDVEARIARRFHGAIDDTINAADSRVKDASRNQHALILWRDAARQMVEQIHNDTKQAVFSMMRRGRGGSIIFGIAYMLDAGWEPSLMAAVAYRTLWDSTLSRSARSAMYAKMGLWLEKYIRQQPPGSPLARPRFGVGPTGLGPGGGPPPPTGPLPPRLRGLFGPGGAPTGPTGQPATAPPTVPRATTVGQAAASTASNVPAQSPSQTVPTAEQVRAASARAAERATPGASNIPAEHPAARAQDEIKAAAAERAEQSQTRSEVKLPPPRFTRPPDVPPAPGRVRRVVDYNWQKMHGAVVDRINSGEVKSGAERASLNREKAVYERIMAGVASKKEIAAAKELYTARLRAREQRGRAAEKAPTQEQVVSASGAGGVAPKTGEPVSGAPSPEEAAIRQQEEARSAVTPLEQKYAELAASDPEGPKWVARLREAAATNKRLGIPWDESGILDDAIKTSNSLPGKRRRGGK